MKKLVAIIIVLATITTVIGCARAKAGMPNPFVACESISDAQKLAGFSVTYSEKSIGSFTVNEIYAIKDTMIEIRLSGDGAVKNLTVRKGTGSEDISGDYNSYPQVLSIKVGERDVTESCKDDRVFVASWAYGGYSYALVADGEGLSSDQTAEIIGSLS